MTDRISGEKNRTAKGTLYLVGTPIGNLSDISERAQKVLRECDFIAAEDTRNSAKLLTLLGIRKELISYHEHNQRARGEEICARLQRMSDYYGTKMFLNDEGLIEVVL